MSLFGNSSLPPQLPESGEAKRFINGEGEITAKVLPGFFYVTSHSESIMTVLGSCIAACIRDPVARVGGMNHFMLPIGDDERASSWGSGGSAANRFGNFAMENLINSLVKHGGVKSRFEIKLFGGGRVLDISTDVGRKNAAFAFSYLEAERMSVVASDVGSDYARKIIYDPMSGRIKLKKLRDVYNGMVANQEKELLRDLKKKPVSGSVELF
ncbi:MAG: chemoreceptor glutamine deamidase CheD [Gammaproteobacteria bacterium]